ncbi:MAG: sulfite exporter TauE/SafE family protein [Prochlorococcaceae cyanobacterium]
MLEALTMVPVGLVAGVLSGFLGIGGGLIFSPLLLLLGLGPHQALATSTLAIVPTTAAGTLTHLRSGRLPPVSALAMASGAVVFGVLFSHLGGLLVGWQLLLLQALLYGLLAVTIRARPDPDATGAGIAMAPAPVGGLLLVGSIAGLASGMLGVGGGLVMVPLLVAGLQQPIHQAVRLSTVAVLAAACGASAQFLAVGRGLPGPALVLGISAACGARWAARRLQGVPPRRLAQGLRLLTVVLAVDSGRRALQLWLQG